MSLPSCSSCESTPPAAKVQITVSGCCDGSRPCGFCQASVRLYGSCFQHGRSCLAMQGETE